VLDQASGFQLSVVSYSDDLVAQRIGLRDACGFVRVVRLRVVSWISGSFSVSSVAVAFERGRSTRARGGVGHPCLVGSCCRTCRLSVSDSASTTDVRRPLVVVVLYRVRVCVR